MNVTVEVDPKIVEVIRKKLNAVSNGLNDVHLIEAIAERVKSNILARTGAGVDADFKAFKPYNKIYAQTHEKSAVNLYLSGQMLNAMTQKAMNPNEARIFFMTQRARDLATIHDQLGAGRSRVVRHFFGVNARDKNEARQLFVTAMAKAKQKAGL